MPHFWQCSVIPFESLTMLGEAFSEHVVHLWFPLAMLDSITGPAVWHAVSKHKRLPPQPVFAFFLPTQIWLSYGDDFKSFFTPLLTLRVEKVSAVVASDDDGATTKIYRELFDPSEDLPKDAERWVSSLVSLASVVTRAVEPVPKQFWTAGAWNLGSGSTDIVCGASKLYK